MALDYFDLVGYKRDVGLLVLGDFEIEDVIHQEVNYQPFERVLADVGDESLPQQRLSFFFGGVLPWLFALAGQFFHVAVGLCNHRTFLNFVLNLLLILQFCSFLADYDVREFFEALVLEELVVAVVEVA